MKLAIQHHVTTNRHHPEFHADANDMSDVDLIEMVCDWTASRRRTNNIGARVALDKECAIRDSDKKFGAVGPQNVIR